MELQGYSKHIIVFTSEQQDASWDTFEHLQSDFPKNLPVGENFMFAPWFFWEVSWPKNKLGTLKVRSIFARPTSKSAAWFAWFRKVPPLSGTFQAGCVGHVMKSTWTAHRVHKFHLVPEPHRVWSARCLCIRSPGTYVFGFWSPDGHSNHLRYPALQAILFSGCVLECHIMQLTEDNLWVSCCFS